MSRQNGKIISWSARLGPKATMAIDQVSKQSFEVLVVAPITADQLRPDRTIKTAMSSSIEEFGRRGKRRIVDRIRFNNQNLLVLRDLLNELHDLGELD